MPNALSITLKDGSEAASGNGDAQDVTYDFATPPVANVYSREACKLVLEVTAATGTTPRLDVRIETSPTGSGSWVQISAFQQMVTVGKQRLAFAPLERFVRAVWTIGGTTPSFTFSVKGEAHAIFCNMEDVFALGLKADVFASLSVDKQARALIAASDRAASSIRAAHSMPIKAWGDDIRMAVAKIAAYEMVNAQVGHRPGPHDSAIKDRHDMAIAWFDDVSRGRAVPEGIVDATPETYEGAGWTVSTASRGW